MAGKARLGLVWHGVVSIGRRGVSARVMQANGKDRRGRLGKSRCRPGGKAARREARLSARSLDLAFSYHQTARFFFGGIVKQSTRLSAKSGEDTPRLRIAFLLSICFLPVSRVS